jgi:hypothetical protein
VRDPVRGPRLEGSQIERCSTAGEAGALTYSRQWPQRARVPMVGLAAAHTFSLA